MDMKETAKKLGVEVAALLAVEEVESSGNGILPDGQIKILFERHKFYQCLARKHGKIFADDVARRMPEICNPQRGGYTKNEHARLQRAVAIDRNCALEAASWGAFQILGSNWVSLGYASLQDFINAMYTEEGQFDGFIRFCQVNGLVDELQRKDWAGFARGYNGPAYRENDYDGKLARAYRKFAARG